MVTLIIPFTHEKTEGFSNLPKVIRLVGGEDRIESQADRLQSPYPQTDCRGTFRGLGSLLSLGFLTSENIVGLPGGAPQPV